jgi:hypothetical protein
MTAMAPPMAMGELASHNIAERLAEATNAACDEALVLQYE